MAGSANGVDKQPEVSKTTTGTRQSISRYEGMTPQSIEYQKTLDAHHASEIRARQDARATVRLLRTWGQDGRKLASDHGFLRGVAVRYGVKEEHHELFIQIIERTINKDLERK